MKKNKKTFFSTITNFIFVLVLIGITIGTIYFIDAINKAPEINIKQVDKRISSKVYDEDDNLIKLLTMEDYKDVSYEDLPDVFINALISSEDGRFFVHDGIDLPRILSALKNDITSMSFKEGASTLTQQLVKNMMLTNSKSLQRKIQEVYLANKIEKIYDKKEILQFYCNFVCFDGVNHGVQHASYKFFNKPINNVTLPEAALLAGIINAPTTYSPIRNPLKANERKNVVLLSMYKQGYINKDEYEKAKNINVEDMLVIKEKEVKTYPYQSYFDVCYKQIYEKTGYDPYITPMEIYTYLNTDVQSYFDKIQQDDSYYENKYQQISSSVIDNNNGSIIAIMGGRNYQGEKLLNRAYDSLYQPGSTIKVILQYALAFQYLNYSNQETLLDIKTYYPNSDILVNNVDKSYFGEISISDAIAFSKNTTAIDVLKQLVDKIGVNKIVNYLKEINLMDEGTFAYSYGLGGYAYGVSVTNLAAAYSMLANSGIYTLPMCVRKIKLLDGSNKEIYFDKESKKVLDESTCYLVSDVLNQVMKKNIYSINLCKPKNINVFAKTGTTSFDSKTKEKLNYPNDASKDKWLASYSKNYSMAIHSGFDEHLKNKPTYFSSTSNVSDTLKKITKNVYSLIEKENQTFNKPSDLVEVNIVKGSNLLATSQVDESYIVKALYKKDNVPKNYFVEPQILDKVSYDYFILNDEITFIFNNDKKEEEYNKIFDIEKILNGKNIYLDIYIDGMYQQTIKCEQIKTIPLQNSYYHFDIYYKYENGFIDGVKESLDFTYN